MKNVWNMVHKVYPMLSCWQFFYEQEVRVSAVLILQNVFYVNFRDKTLPDCIRFPMQICVRSEELVR